jgi:murein DD-endopeptidase MepM/ murein hydrolase activator NlpD
MTPARPAFTVMIHRDGDLQSRSYRIPVLAWRVGLGIGLLFGVTVVLGAALYLPVVRAAARVPSLTREVSRLEADNARIRDLVAALDSAESRYSQLRQMLGADIVPDPLALGATLPIAPALRARAPGVTTRYETGASTPTHWPLDDPGYLTRGQVGSGTREEAHPGIDIAVPSGTLVRAAGGGSVLQSGIDPEYGSFVLLQHPDGYQTMYGHLSRIAVNANSTVDAGQVIGVSGNSGHSSAPHLHFEIRRDGQSLDPLQLVKEGT